MRPRLADLAKVVGVIAISFGLWACDSASAPPPPPSPPAFPRLAFVTNQADNTLSMYTVRSNPGWPIAGRLPPLDPARYEDGREAALAALERNPELEHDDGIWFAFTERIVLAMGGRPPASYDCAIEITRGWEEHDNFELYEDVVPVLEELRAAGLKIGLVSNSARDVHAFVRWVDAMNFDMSELGAELRELAGRLPGLGENGGAGPCRLKSCRSTITRSSGR